MRHVMRLLRRIRGRARAVDAPARPGLSEALAMFDYGASDDPC